MAEQLARHVPEWVLSTNDTPKNIKILVCHTSMEQAIVFGDWDVISLMES